MIPRKASALEALFARIFRIVAGKEYILNVQWSHSRQSYSRPLHPSLIRLVLGGAFALALGLGCLGFVIGRWAFTEVEYHVVVARHHMYLASLQKTKASMAVFENILDTAFEQEQKMRALYGINTLSQAQSTFGIGGHRHPTAEDSNLSTGLYESLFDAGQKSRQLHGKLEFALRNFRQISEFVAYRQNLWDHTPSVEPARGELTSPFGFRVHPITHEYIFHEGVDIANNPWTPIYATADGIVSATESGGNYGNMVVIDHGNGYQTRYAHMNRIMVEKGQLIKRFALVGYMGSTGLSTGSHVHYEVRRDGVPINPEKFILPSGEIVD